MAVCRCVQGVWPGWVLRESGADPNGNPYRVWEPCPDCGGSGIISCCDVAGASIAEGSHATGDGVSEGFDYAVKYPIQSCNPFVTKLTSALRWSSTLAVRVRRTPSAI
jgi:hypothetical protein